MQGFFLNFSESERFLPPSVGKVSGKSSCGWQLWLVRNQSAVEVDHSIGALGDGRVVGHHQNRQAVVMLLRDEIKDFGAGRSCLAAPRPRQQPKPRRRGGPWTPWIADSQAIALGPVFRVGDLGAIIADDRVARRSDRPAPEKRNARPH